LSAPAFLDEKMQKNAKVVSFGIFICKNAIKNAKTVISGVFYIKNAKKRRSGVFIYKNGKKPDWSESFPRNNSPSSDHRKMLYSSFERARRELSNDTKIIFLASIDRELPLNFI
jgi:hypothetical protein